MDRLSLIQLHLETCEDARKIMERKNQDYSNGSDPFKNFRGSSQYDVDPMKGILIRIGDKLQRFNSFIERGDLKVSDESLRDTTMDVINYMILLYAMGMEKDSQRERLAHLRERSNDLKGREGLVAAVKDWVQENNPSKIQMSEAALPGGGTFLKETNKPVTKTLIPEELPEEYEPLNLEVKTNEY